MTLSDMIRDRGRVLSLLDLVELMKPLDINTLLDWMYMAGYSTGMGRAISDISREHVEIFNDLPDDIKSNMNKIAQSAPPGDMDTDTHKIKLVCEALDCDLTESVFDDWSKFNHGTSHFEILQRDTRVTLHRELKSKTFLYIEPNNARLWKDPLYGWEDVTKKIQATVEHIDNANRCLALGMDTASVFHILGAIEEGLRYINKQRSLIIPPLENEQTWGKWIGAIDTYTNGNIRKNSPVTVPNPSRPQTTELNEILDDLRSIQKVWRDPTMHVKKSYDHDRAERIIDRAKSLLHEIVNIKKSNK